MSNTPLPPLPTTPAGSEDSFVIKCPQDGHEMESVRAGNSTVDRCLECGGLWFDMAELQRMIAHDVDAKDFDTFGEKARAAPRLRSLCCPRDGHELKSTPDPQQPQVIYHQCQNCGGLYLRAGDLLDLSQYNVSERLKSFFRM